jgi:Protein of unknown function (DUF4238)
MAAEEARDHHYAPQFFLRNFAVDQSRNRVTTVAKHGSLAVWAERSIQKIAHERDFYVHMSGGIPVSVETAINQRIETPLSQSDTWAKIAAGRTDALDASDKPILYALIRHLEARTPHYEATMKELALMAEDPDSEIPFTADERAQFAFLRAHKDFAKMMFNTMAATLTWTESAFKGAGMTVLRSAIPLRSSTIPVLSIPAPPHPAIKLPLPGMMPYTLILMLNTATVLCLNLGDFDGEFLNMQIDQQTALGLNRYFVGQFAHFPQVRHLIASRENLADDMAWAHYALVKDERRTMTFRRVKAVS